MSALPPLPQSATASDTEASSQRSMTSSRSSVASSYRSSQRSGGSGRSGSQQHGHGGSSVGSGSVRSSQRSITSSVALGKLQALEGMLSQERRARERAETTLLALQKERSARHEADSRNERSQEQLSSVMSALQRVLTDPQDGNGIRKLQAIVRGAPVRNVATPDLRAEKQHHRQHAVVDHDTIDSNNKEPRSFLDAIGKYDRDQKKK